MEENRRMDEIKVKKYAYMYLNISVSTILKIYYI